MAAERQPHTIQPDRPARPPAESREETIERAIEEADSQHVHAREELVDPTSRRGVNGLIATLILLAREDGRIEREVERKTGRGPEPPGSPIDPKHDVDGR
jgi:hypothetical protein